MHIPDAYLSPATEAVAFGVMVPIWAIAAKRTARDLSAKQAPLLSIGAAFCFAIQMFNIPAVGGTTAHALGSTLLAILVGPWAALLGMTLSLTIQALLFGDGGILALGANCWDMGFVACFVGYGVYRFVAGSSSGGTGRQISAAAVGALVGTVTASFSAGVLLGIQPIVAHDAAGHALYCPYGLSVSVPAMVMSHLLVAGPADAIVTVAALAYLWRSFPELASANVRPKVGTGLRIARAVVWVLLLTPIGLIASGDAWGEWDLATLMKRIGYAPAGIKNSHELVHPLLPDYGFAGMEGKPWEVAGYLVSAFIGCCLVAGFTRGILKLRAIVPVEDLPPGAPSREIPAWMHEDNPPIPPATGHRAPWFENTILRMRTTMAKTVAAEEIAHASGLLQSVNPLAKAITFLTALIAVGLAQTPWPLVGILGLVVAVARVSAVPLKGLLIRVGEAVAFFGLVVAIPLSLRSVTSGPSVGAIFGLEVSSTGLHSALMILLRISAGICLAMVWNLTTKWYDLLRSLRSLGAPQMFLTMATLTYRYLFVVMETMAEMVEARTVRQVGAIEKRQARTYAGNGTAILFAKSHTFTEEMHQAMQSRGFDRVTRLPRSHTWTVIDSLAVGIGVLCLVGALLHGVIHAL